MDVSIRITHIKNNDELHIRCKHDLYTNKLFSVSFYLLEIRTNRQTYATYKKGLQSIKMTFTSDSIDHGLHKA